MPPGKLPPSWPAQGAKTGVFCTSTLLPAARRGVLAARTTICGTSTANLETLTANGGTLTAYCGTRTTICGTLTANCGTGMSVCGTLTAYCGTLTAYCGTLTTICGTLTAYCGTRTGVLAAGRGERFWGYGGGGLSAAAVCVQDFAVRHLKWAFLQRLALYVAQQYYKRHIFC